MLGALIAIGKFAVTNPIGRRVLGLAVAYQGIKATFGSKAANKVVELVTKPTPPALRNQVAKVFDRIYGSGKAFQRADKTLTLLEKYIGRKATKKSMAIDLQDLFK